MARPNTMSRNSTTRPGNDRITHDITPIAEVSQRAGIPIQVGLFVASSPMRQEAEAWELDRLLRLTEDAVDFAMRQGLDVMYVAEDDRALVVDVVLDGRRDHDPGRGQEQRSNPRRGRDSAARRRLRRALQKRNHCVGSSRMNSAMRSTAC
jgi:hypothetical protein